MRSTAPLLAAVLLASQAAPADAKVTVRWHGQSFFEIQSGAGTRVVLDPHAIDAYGRKDVQADLVLCSHLHNDHTQLDVVTNDKKTVLFGVKARGDGKRTEWNPIDQKFKDVHVRTVGTYHDTLQGMERGRNAVFVLEVDGLRIAHLGDLGHVLTESQVKQIGPVDVLLIPVGGVYTINGSEAKRVVEQLKPRQYIIPMHYGTRVYDALLTAEEFLDEQTSVKKLDTNQFVIDTKAAPSEPTIVVLHWASGK